MKTTLAKNPGDKREWYVVDAAGQTLGRLAVRVADILRGRNRADYTPHTDMGGGVVVINARKVVLTGRKEEQKLYKRYSGFRGGLTQTPANVVRAKNPDLMIKQAVWGMLPDNRLSRRIYRRLKVYADAKHEQAAQKPVTVN